MNDDRLTPELFAAIERVERDLKAARAKLASESSFHAAAWAEYGSELCAGEMMSKEREIERSIRALEADLDLLYRYGDGKAEAALSSADERRLTEIETAKTELDAEREQIRDRLVEAERIAALLGR